MKVVRPEWLLESVNIGYLLPWKNYIYVHHERIESTQGAKTSQISLVGQSSEPLSTESNQTGTTSNPDPPKSLSVVLRSKKSEHVQDPLYTTDPKTKADAARVPGYAAFKSNPNAQRAMAKPEWRKAHTSVSSDFIEGYYKNSRLHHLSMWKSELKNLVQEAQERAESGPISGHVGKIAAERDASNVGGTSMRGAELILRSPTSKWKGKGRAVDNEDRVIMHCDFDCFFVSAGLLSRPELKGKAVVVCHSQGAQGGTSSTSEIASSSYEARKFGIHNGMRYIFSFLSDFTVINDC
jgi:DNA repair protein REV1